MKTINVDDDAMFNNIDKMVIDNLLHYDMKQLEEARKKSIEQNKDCTPYFDKAIAMKKRREMIERKQERRERKMMRRSFFWGLVSGFGSGMSTPPANDSLMPWERDLVDKGEYEPYHFEED